MMVAANTPPAQVRKIRGGSEMVIIKTTCPSCGEIDLTAEKVQLRIALGGTGSSYAFDCPRCTDRIRKPADGRVGGTQHQGGHRPGSSPHPYPCGQPALHSRDHLRRPARVSQGTGVRCP